MAFPDAVGIATTGVADARPPEGTRSTSTDGPCAGTRLGGRGHGRARPRSGEGGRDLRVPPADPRPGPDGGPVGGVLTARVLPRVPRWSLRRPRRPSRARPAGTARRPTPSSVSPRTGFRCLFLPPQFRAHLRHHGLASPSCRPAARAASARRPGSRAAPWPHCPEPGHLRQSPGNRSATCPPRRCRAGEVSSPMAPPEPPSRRGPPPT